MSDGIRAAHAIVEAREEGFRAGLNASTYWLIEHYDHNQPDGHRWLRIWIIGSVNGIPKAELTWTNDAQTALRFSRQQDAEHFALLHRDWCVLATVTEHADMAPKDGVAVDRHQTFCAPESNTDG